MVNTSQLDFCTKLDTLPLPKGADVVVVLRHITPEQTSARFALGLSLLPKLNSKMIMMPYSSNTVSEAREINFICSDLHYQNVVLVTHKYHSYRALLTFINLGSPVRYHVASVPTPLSLIEFVKIMEYREKGDVASYEKGMEYLNAADFS